MPRWHEAGKINISNPAEVREKLIPRFKMDAILKYYGTSWVNALIDGHQYSAGAAFTHKPGSNADLMLWNSEKGAENGAELANGLFVIGINILNIAADLRTYKYYGIGLLYIDEPKWNSYKGPERLYAAIVAWHL